MIEGKLVRLRAVEPSDAMETLVRNTRDLADRVTLVPATGDKLPGNGDLDFVVSLGVLHHIPDPAPVVRRRTTWPCRATWTPQSPRCPASELGTRFPAAPTWWHMAGKVRAPFAA